MVKLGMVGKILIHNYPYGAYFNGVDEEKLQTRCSKPWMLEFIQGRFPEPVAKNSRITHVWAGERDEAERIADSCRIENVCDDLDEVIENVEGVFILDEDIPFRTETVGRCLQRRKPIFVDKVLALSVEKTRELLALAREKNVQIAAWSQLLFAAESAQFKDTEGGAGFVTFNLARDNVPGYGIHVVCSAFGAFGMDPVHMSAVDTGTNGDPMIAVTYANGKNVVLLAGTDVPPRGNICYFGRANAPILAQLSDMGAMFYNSAETLADMFENGKQPAPPEAIMRMTEAVSLLCQ